MTRGPIRLREECFVGRVVQVDVVIVGKEELHETERVLRPRLLPDARLLAVLVVLHVLPREIAAIGGDLGGELLLLDVRRDVPVRPKDDGLHRVAEGGRHLPLVLGTDDHLHAERLLPAVVRVEPERGDVDVDVAGAEGAWQPAVALEVGGDLPRALVGRNIERGERRCVERAVGGEPVAILELRELRGELWTHRRGQRRRVGDAGLARLSVRRRRLAGRPASGLAHPALPTPRCSRVSDGARVR